MKRNRLIPRFQFVHPYYVVYRKVKEQCNPYGGESEDSNFMFNIHAVDDREASIMFDKFVEMNWPSGKHNFILIDLNSFPTTSILRLDAREPRTDWLKPRKVERNKLRDDVA